MKRPTGNSKSQAREAAYIAAMAADQRYSATIRAAFGWHATRWTISHAQQMRVPAVAAAYREKVAADNTLAGWR